MPATRRQRAAIENEEMNAEETDVDSDFDESDVKSGTFVLDGKHYETYNEMVAAKRRRNREMLMSSGLLEAAEQIREDVTAAKAVAASKRGLSKKRKSAAPPPPRRKSNRIAGVKAEGFYVKDERSGRFLIGGLNQGPTETREAAEGSSNVQLGSLAEKFFNDRVNDGSDLAIKQAVELSEGKWSREESVPSAERFMKQILPSFIEGDVAKDHGISECGQKKEVAAPASAASTPCASPKSVLSTKVSRHRSKPQQGDTGLSTLLSSKVNDIELDDPAAVAKVTPDRIYAIACHPSSNLLLACAGDKQGHVGLWNVDQISENTNSEGKTNMDGVHLFKVHNRPVTHIEWNKSGTSMFSASYDGSVRMFDIGSQVFTEIFATYDESSEFKNKPGYGLDEGYNFWVQYACLDHRSADDRCLFLATSLGTVVHVDLRSAKKITFNEELSVKKINSLSLHPNGTALATAGLDNTVKIWDIRKFSSNKSGKKSHEAKPVATQFCGRSISSAFFSPSGKSLVSTTMANTLDLTHDAHLMNGKLDVSRRIRHNNMTGRWLSTFMATWHPTVTNEELFVVGSMQQPRTIELFDGSKGELLRGIQGNALTAVASRCCFHPSEDKLIVVGGNSSGRVTIAR